MRLRQVFTPSHPAHLALGLALWAAWFVIVYGGVSLACVWAPPAEAGPFTWINAGVAVLTAATAAILLLGALFCWRARNTSTAPANARRFIARVSAGLYVVAAVATVGVGAPAVRLPPCAPLTSAAAESAPAGRQWEPIRVPPR